MSLPVVSCDWLHWRIFACLVRHACSWLIRHRFVFWTRAETDFDKSCDTWYQLFLFRSWDCRNPCPDYRIYPSARQGSTQVLRFCSLATLSRIERILHPPTFHREVFWFPAWNCSEFLWFWVRFWSRTLPAVFCTSGFVKLMISQFHLSPILTDLAGPGTTI